MRSCRHPAQSGTRRAAGTRQRSGRAAADTRRNGAQLIPGTRQRAFRLTGEPGTRSGAEKAAAGAFPAGRGNLPGKQLQAAQRRTEAARRALRAQLVPAAIRKGATVGSWYQVNQGRNQGANYQKAVNLKGLRVSELQIGCKLVATRLQSLPRQAPADGQKGGLQGFCRRRGRNTRGKPAGRAGAHRGRETGTRCRQGRSWYQGTRAAPAAGFPSYRYQAGSCRRSGIGAAIRTGRAAGTRKDAAGAILRL